MTPRALSALRPLRRMRRRRSRAAMYGSVALMLLRRARRRRRRSRGDLYGSGALLLLRLAVGGLLMGHGAQKLFGAFGGGGLDGTAESFDQIGFRPGRAQAAVAGSAELGGGTLLAMGFLTPLGAAATSGTMVGAIAGVSGRKGLWIQQGGAEYNGLLAAASIAVALAGPGRFSLDRLLGTERRGPLWAAAALAAATAGGIGALRIGRRMPPSTGRSDDGRVSQDATARGFAASGQD